MVGVGASNIAFTLSGSSAIPSGRFQRPFIWFSLGLSFKECIYVLLIQALIVCLQQIEDKLSFVLIFSAERLPNSKTKDILIPCDLGWIQAR